MQAHSSIQQTYIEHPLWATQHSGRLGFTSEEETQIPPFNMGSFYHALYIVWEKEMATHSSALAWRMPGTEEPGGLQSIGLHIVRHDWSDLACMNVLEEEMATHSSVLAWRIPGTEEPDGLSSMRSQSWTRLKWLSSRNYIVYKLIQIICKALYGLQNSLQVNRRCFEVYITVG